VLTVVSLWDSFGQMCPADATSPCIALKDEETPGETHEAERRTLIEVLMSSCHRQVSTLLTQTRRLTTLNIQEVASVVGLASALLFL
jgi:hypothetical protein